MAVSLMPQTAVSGGGSVINGATPSSFCGSRLSLGDQLGYLAHQVGVFTRSVV